MSIQDLKEFLLINPSGPPRKAILLVDPDKPQGQIKTEVKQQQTNNQNPSSHNISDKKFEEKEICDRDQTHDDRQGPIGQSPIQPSAATAQIPQTSIPIQPIVTQPLVTIPNDASILAAMQAQATVQQEAAGIRQSLQNLSQQSQIAPAQPTKPIPSSQFPGNTLQIVQVPSEPPDISAQIPTSTAPSFGESVNTSNGTKARNFPVEGSGITAVPFDNVGNEKGQDKGRGALNDTQDKEARGIIFNKI